MYRVVLPACFSLLAGACSLGSPSSLSFGLTDKSPPPPAQAAAVRSATTGLGGDPASQRKARADGQKTAALDDRAPKGTFDKAPPGALADRDYADTSLNVERARELINGYRKEKGLKPLTLNVELTNAAKAHSRDLAKWDRISHFGSDGSNPWDRVKRAGYNAKVAAENVGTGQVSFDEVLKGWKESPGHNKNLLMTDVEHMGLALVKEPKSEFKSFWTLVLGSRL